MRAIAYLRVSTEQQVENGVSLDTQLAKIKLWCELNNYELASIHQDAGMSGAKMAERPGLLAALAETGKHDALVVYSLSRLARSTWDTLTIADRLAKAGADLVSLSERIETTSAAGKMIFRILAVLAEFERDQISERTKAALSHKRALGQRISGRLPWGFRLAEPGSKMLVRDLNEERVAKMIVDMFVQGTAPHSIAKILAARGIVGREGTAIGYKAVEKIIHKRFNCTTTREARLRAEESKSASTEQGEASKKRQSNMKGVANK